MHLRFFRGSYGKVIAIGLFPAFLMQMFLPNQVYALTGGPSQPEVESFEPVGTTQMVDLYSGDFNYNIPLLTVPGPNGGYPINLAYHAGIGMEQQASWCGLGWNINPGAITRAMRGLPDDFSGDQVIHETYIKPNVTVGIIGSLNGKKRKELLGFDIGIQNAASVYYNNYRGVGYRLETSVKGTTNNYMGACNADIDEESIVGNASLAFDSQTGIGFSAGLSATKISDGKRKQFHAGAGFHSRQGLMTVSFRGDLPKYAASNIPTLHVPGGAGVNFASTTFVPAVSTPMRGFSAQVGFEPGVEGTGLIYTTKKRFGLTGELVVNRIPEDQISRSFSAYGYLNAQHAAANSANSLFDFNREKDGAVTKHTPSIYLPVSTHDVFMIQGQGTGGVFRPFRSDVATYHDPVTNNRNNGVNLGIEFALPLVESLPPDPDPDPSESNNGTHWKIGANLGYSFSNHYSGKWKNNNNLSHLKFHENGQTGALSQSYYFKSNGELTAYDQQYMDNVGHTAPISMDMRLSHNGSFFEPEVLTTHSHGAGTLYPDESRKRKAQHIEYTTKEALNNRFDHGIRPAEHLYPFNTYPFDGAGALIDHSMGGSSHIHEIAVLNPDGNRYVYGLPAYNTTQQDYAFAINSGLSDYTNPKTIGYTASDRAPKNNNGQDHFYSKTAKPAYAHAYMLTGVFAHDYVDLTGNGPSDDDMGYFCKFNYSELDAYQWRHPYQAANFVKGYYSNDQDDKATFSYGQKKIYYVNSIETKTHIAVFELGDRADGMEASGLDGVATGSTKLKYLKSITLYSKNDAGYASGNAVPIKKVNLVYDYSLCKNVPNNDAGHSLDPGHELANQGGKLTLKKVFFTYLGNEKGRLSPFQFEYGQANPDYNQRQYDRWGHYQPEAEIGQSRENSENPYTYQGADYTNRHANAAAWCMDRIILPSGGEINIDYESDDYGFVQDKQAMQMCQVLATQNATEPVFNSETEVLATTRKNKLNKKYSRIYFRMNSATDNATDYVQGIASSTNAIEKEVLFKTWQRLKRKVLNGAVQAPAPYAYDYVEGYCGINTAGIGQVPGTSIGYFEVHNDTYGTGDAFPIHPFKKAGWQYLKFERPDLFLPPNEPGGSILNIITNTLNILKEAATIFGYYNKAAAFKYCSELDLDAASGHFQPSFIRLNNPNFKKYGGGCRVAKLSLSDNWIEGNPATYGQEYIYANRDGTSSGVADYEPLVGGEENPFRKPVWYNGNDKAISIRHEDVYHEEPYGESYFPAANVGYGRVEVRSLTHPDITKNQDGIVVNEFYTCKDFPTIVNKGPLNHKGLNLPTLIPFIGSINVMHNGYAQGYAIELNDMSGKPKAISTYKYGSDFSEEPVAKTEYVYHTNPGNPRQLSNEVQVLTADGQEETATMGLNFDFVMDEREHSTFTLHAGAQANLDGILALFVPTLLPGTELTTSMFRSIGSTKVIYRNGILKEIINHTDGAEIKTTNLVYDAQTGGPLLTSVTNEYKKPVFTYNYPAQWNYEGMGGAYQNYRAVAELGNFIGPEYELAGATDPSAIFFPGDVVSVFETDQKYHQYHVTIVTPTDVTLVDEEGVVPTGLTGLMATVIRSGRKNHLSMNSGSIVTLSDLSDPVPPILEAFNTNTFIDPMIIPNYTDPCGNQYDNTQMTISGNVITIESNGPVVEGCLTSLTADPSVNLAPNANITFDIRSYRIAADGLAHINVFNNGTGLIHDFVWHDEQNCFAECIKVLHADATKFAEAGWSYNYQDVGAPEITPNNGARIPLVQGVANPYRYGQRGIWRIQRQNVYLIDRLQSGSNNARTRSDLDGEYARFEPFDWSDPAFVDNNEQWQWTSEITQYSPYGFELERRDRLDIYSAEMYGYNNSTVTAAGSNARYHEIAFDGFEDYISGPQIGAQPLTVLDHGHFEWKIINAHPYIRLEDRIAHSGKYSVFLAQGGRLQHLRTAANQNNFFIPRFSDKPYTASAWIYTRDGGTVTLQITSGSHVYSKSTGDPENVTIDGWTRVQVNIDFFDPASPITKQVDIQVINTSDNAVYIDDIRIQPLTGEMKTFVYDPDRLWLVAEHDNFNFTTFYSYDEEGTLVQVKQETERGIITLSTSRQNTKQIQ